MNSGYSEKLEVGELYRLWVGPLFVDVSPRYCSHNRPIAVALSGPTVPHNSKIYQTHHGSLVAHRYIKN